MENSQSQMRGSGQEFPILVKKKVADEVQRSTDKSLSSIDTDFVDQPCQPSFFLIKITSFTPVHIIS